MPVAVPLIEQLKAEDYQQVVEAMISLAVTFSALHDKAIYHRDIKPTNLFMYDGSYCVGDFGLFDYPEKGEITQTGESVGPKWTMAPEMRRDPINSEGGSADVYSLAKTLWIFMTGEVKGFEGQYVKGGNIALINYQSTIYTTPLDDLLFEATDNDPEKRPTMEKFAHRVAEWKQLNEDYAKTNRAQWIEIQKRIFPMGIPQRASWEEIDDIIEILNIVGSYEQLNHIFFPDGGGLDLDEAKISTVEKGCIELNCGGIISLVKPKKLMFESFGNDEEWNYFRLETGDLKETGVYSPSYLNGERSYEPLTELTPGEYVDYGAWDNSEYKGEPLPKTARGLTRYLKGTFVLFRKTSLYNKNRSTYNARHNKMISDEFREYIRKVIDQVKGEGYTSP